jgi:GTPase SAR1 family protein
MIKFSIRDSVLFSGQDIVVITFNIGDITDIKTMRAELVPEIDEFCQNKPKLLVGCKLDQRTTVAPGSSSKDTVSLRKVCGLS